MTYVASVDTFKICYDSASRLNQSRFSGVLQSKLVWSLKKHDLYLSLTGAGPGYVGIPTRYVHSEISELWS